ncbi:MAG: rod shape-determining protein MreD [Lachnospiraceae bacterium]|nr:rod shape-determining protein MreD [Lachnospiraceae bacterium]
MKRLVEALAIILCFLLQSTIFQHIAFAGIVPNLMIIITSIFGFMEGRSDGMVVGFICGLLTDIFYGSVLGLNALIYLLIGYANGAANRGFYPDDIKFPLLFISVSDIVYLVMTYLSGFLLRARFNVGYYFLHIMLPELVYTIIVSLFVYLILRGILLRIEGSFEESEQ